MAKKQKKKEREQKYIPAEGFISTYANSVRVGITLWDFSLVFGEIEEATPDFLSVKENARVMMSPEHAMAFFEVLQRNIKLYEEKFGKIRFPAASTSS